jgi:hypothetical protein
MGGNKKDRAFTTSLGERDGFDSVHPVAYMSEVQRDKLLKANGIDVYPSRSEECYPCIYQMSVRDLAGLDSSRIELINDYEVKITNVRNARGALLDIKPEAIDIAVAKAENVEYDEWNFFGMFNYKKCGFKKGIVEQSKWAKERVKYLDSLPKQQGLFTDEVVIDDKCKSGYCGL